MEELIKKLRLQLRILQLQLEIKLLQKKRTVPNIKEIKGIIIHHGAGQLGFIGVNKYHKNKWGFKSSLGYYIGYTYFLEKDGTVYQGRRDTEEGAHTRGYNKGYIGIGLQGNFEIENITDKQYKALTDLISRKQKQYNLSNKDVHLHQEYANTLCPGRNLTKKLDKDYK
jgi:N-acetylmuramoyl-L-alanine amidase